MKIKSAIALFICLVTAAAMLCGCSRKSEGESAALAAVKTREELSLNNTLMFTSDGENGICAESEIFPSFNSDIYSSYSFAAAVCGTGVCEYGMFEAKDKESAEKTAEMISARLALLCGEYEGCIEESYQTAKNAEIRTQGLFVYYAATDNNDDVFSSIEAIM